MKVTIEVDKAYVSTDKKEVLLIIDNGDGGSEHITLDADRVSIEED